MIQAHIIDYAFSNLQAKNTPAI